MVKPAQVLDGLMAYMEQEVLPHIEGWKSWVVSAALIRLYQSAEKVLPLLLENPTVAALGLVDAAGMIDIDTAAATLKETARKRGKLEVDVPMLGKMRFGEDDFDVLAARIKESRA